MEYIGLIAAVCLLVWLALKGVNIVFSAVLSSLVVILTNGLPVSTGLTEYFAFGPLGAFTFAGKFFLLLASGAIFGRVMGESHAATSIAMMLVNRLGASRALWITTLACALLTYSGVVVFIVIFAMYPVGLKLLQQADIPKRLFCAALALGGGTFTLSALPGTPSVQNVIAASTLGTDLFAGATLGIIGSILMFAFGIWYLERQRIKAQQLGEHFVPGPNDKISSNEQDTETNIHWGLALLPLIVVIGTIVMPRILNAIVGGSLADNSLLTEMIVFAKSQPIVWPSFALMLGSILALLLFPSVRRHPLLVLGQGTNDSINPLINTAAVIGFGGVVTHTVGFEHFIAMMLDSGLPPLLSMVTSISFVSAITGSSAGGLQIFMQTMAPSYLAMGIEPETLHRIAAIASGGFDSLPHCGAIVAMLSITGLTHKEAYKDVGIITVVIPVAVTLLLVGIATVM